MGFTKMEGSASSKGKTVHLSGLSQMTICGRGKGDEECELGAKVSGLAYAFAEDSL